MDKERRTMLNENKKYLTYLLKNKATIYNKVKYEILRKGVNTCGAHCSYRCYKFMKDGLTLSEYQQHMNYISKIYGITYDKIVSAFASYFIG